VDTTALALDFVLTLGLGIGFAFLLAWADAPGRGLVAEYTWMFVAAGVALVLSPALIVVPWWAVLIVLGGFVCVGVPVVLYCTWRDHVNRVEAERHADAASTLR
jgi:hypothetical protein